MNKILLVILFLVSVSIESFSQSITWQKLYPAQSGTWSRSRTVCKADSGNFYLAGTIAGSIYALKIDPYGNTIWTRTLAIGDAFTIVSSGDGGFVLTGGNNTPYTYKISSTGDVIWHKTYPGAYKQCYDMKRSTDGGYIACGRDFDSPYEDAYLLKVDSLGNLQWQRSYTNNYEIVFTSIELAHDGGYVVAGGVKYSQQDTFKAFIKKLDDAGSIVWEKFYTKFGILKVIRTGTGYLTGGGNDTAVGYGNIVISKMNKFGDTLFTHTLLNNSRWESLFDIKMVNTNRFVISALKDSANGQVFLGRTKIIDSLCNIIYQNTYPTPNYILMYCALPLPNGDIIFAGEADFNSGPFSVYAMRTDSMLRAPEIVIGIKKVEERIPSSFKLYQNYPNPFNPMTTILYDVVGKSNVKIMIFDISGKLVSTLVNQIQQGGRYEVDLDMNSLSSGVYFYQLSVNGQIFQTKKMMLVK